MPELARFFGIVVVMLYRDHAPPTSTPSMGRRSDGLGSSPFGC